MQNRQRRKRRRIGHNAELGRQGKAPEEQPGQTDELEQPVDFNGWNCSKLPRAANCKLP